MWERAKPPLLYSRKDPEKESPYDDPEDSIPTQTEGRGNCAVGFPPVRVLPAIRGSRYSTVSPFANSNGAERGILQSLP